MNKNLTITSILGAITIILGAFGAHALKDKLGVYELKSFETAVKYQMFHVLVLLFINTTANFTSKIKNQLTLLFLFGILFFSGSIYAIAFGVPAKLIWFITPLGGLLFIIGWLKMAFVFYKKS